MKKKDAEAVPWMATKTRKAWPQKVIWGKSGKRSERFYWLGGKPKDVVIASVKGQEIVIKGAGETPLTLFLNDKLLDLDEPVKVFWMTRKFIMESWQELRRRFNSLSNSGLILKWRPPRSSLSKSKRSIKRTA